MNVKQIMSLYAYKYDVNIEPFSKKITHLALIIMHLNFTLSSRFVSVNNSSVKIPKAMGVRITEVDRKTARQLLFQYSTLNST